MKSFHCSTFAVLSLSLIWIASPANAQTPIAKPTILRRVGTSTHFPSIPSSLPLQFDPGTSFETGGTKPVDVAVGDVNHDGKSDLVVINQDQHNVAVMLGHGDGTFDAPVTYSLPFGTPMQVALADFNGDGKLDIAVITGAVDGNISFVLVRLGNGDGTFGSVIATPAGVDGLTIKAADVNGDGRQDVVVGGNGSAAVLFGNGNARFRTPVLLSSSSGPLVDGSVGDVNGDGRLDIVCAISNPAAGIAVFLQNSDGSFTPGQVLTTQYTAGAAVALADFDQDGKLDLMLSAYNELLYLAGNGDGTFQAPIELEGGASTGPIALADFNRDGSIDSAFAYFSVYPTSGLFVMANTLGSNIVVSGTTGGTTGLAVGDFNGDGWPDVVTADSIGNRVTVFLNLVGINRGPLQFVAVAPCRLMDTRSWGPMDSGSYGLLFQGSGTCAANIPPAAAALSLNITTLPAGPLGYLNMFPLGDNNDWNSSILNSPDGRIKANAAIVATGNMQGVSLYLSDRANLVLDLNGYFEPVTPSTLAYYPVTPCRVFDTRNDNGPLGGPYLQGGVKRDFPVLSSNCQIPSEAQAYSMNFTAVPYDGKSMGYLTVWAKGAPQPPVSTLNNPTATIVANAALVQAGGSGDITVYPDADTQLVGDITGYFAPPQPGGLSYYPLQPCRAIDTRQGSGAFTGQLTVDVQSGPWCPPIGTVQAYVLNATVVPTAPLYYLTLWPDGQGRPAVSTLNAMDGQITSNMAIVSTSNDEIDAYASGMTNLILDLSGYFAP